MKPATKLLIIFSLIFCLVASEDSDAFNKSSDVQPDALEDYRRLKYLARCSIVKLKSGEFELLTDGTLKVDAYSLTLNKTYFDTENDTAIICKPYKFPWNCGDLLLFPLFVGTLVLLFCMVLFATQEYNTIYWTAFATASVLYTVNIITQYISYILQDTDYKIDHDIHFVGLQLFFWISSLACDALMLSVVGKGSSHISSIRFRFVVTYSFIKLISLLAILPFLNASGILPSEFPTDSLDNYIRTITSFVLVGLYNLMLVLMFYYRIGPKGTEQKRLLEIFAVNSIFCSIMVCGWYLEYIFVMNGLEDYLSFVFQGETALAFICVIWGVMKFCLGMYDARALGEPIIIKKVAKKFKGILLPSEEQNLQVP